MKMDVSYGQLENGLELVLSNLKRYKSDEDYRRLTAMYALKVVRHYGHMKPFESRQTMKLAVDDAMLGVDEERKSSVVGLIIWVKNNHGAQRRKAMKRKSDYDVFFSPGEDPHQMYFDYMDELQRELTKRHK